MPTRLKCPVCKTPTTWRENPWRPFCSERCKMIDLGKWALEEYRVPAEKAGESDEVRESEG